MFHIIGSANSGKPLFSVFFLLNDVWNICFKNPNFSPNGILRIEVPRYFNKSSITKYPDTIEP